MNAIYILGIETSCDDTCAAIIKDGNVLSNVVKSQYSHKKYGGIVPELASREHLNNINKTVNEALKIANINKKQLSAIAFTKGPGLIGPLLVGSMYAKGLSLGLKIPLIAVNHLKAHALAYGITNKLDFPFLCLLASGGNTQIVLVKSYNSFDLLGKTLDDAVGEAYDKIAKMLGIEYPGGPLIAKYSQDGDNKRFKFPKANVDGFNFSFSGIKTAVKNFLNENTKSDENFIKDNFADICASVQESLVGMLLEKIELAISKIKVNAISIGGGVAANQYLRIRLKELAEDKKIKLFIPEKQFCTDNAAMIGYLGYLNFLDKNFADINTAVNPDLKY